MDEIKQEFEAYLRDWVASYHDADNSEGSHADYSGGRLKNFNADAERKMYELISRDRNISAADARLELTSLTVKYHQILINEVL